MSDLQDMLRVQARLHRKQGANALGQLFESDIEEIQLLNKTYNQLFDAFQDCQGELAKANERVTELEQELKESDDDLYVTQQQSSNYESALEEIQAIFVDSDSCPLFEPFNPKNLSAWLNKFAIDKKAEGVKGFVKSFKFLDDAHCVNIIEVRDAASHYIEEQLRKGGES